MKLRTVEELGELKGRRVLVRCNFDVPVADGTVLPHAAWRIDACVPFLSELASHGARTVILSHRGRPGGVDPAFSLRPAFEYLKTKLPGLKYFDKGEPHDGELMLLENLRFSRRETAGDETFAEELASLGEVYINNDFATSHRAHASIVILPKLLPSFPGPLLYREVEELSAVRDFKGDGLVVVMGGAKSETKIALIERFLPRALSVLVGGVLANTILRARGYPVGSSVVDEGADLAGIDISSDRLVAPRDVTVSSSLAEAKNVAVKDARAVQETEAIVDVGPETVREFAGHLTASRLTVWNGPLGLVEVDAFSAGTRAFAGRFAHSPGRTVVGGGDTVPFLAAEGLLTGVDYVSTGGGAMLKFLAGETLPGIEALTKSS